ncbi:hypothetical protein ACLB2K_059713 [Fragaria x ananassa]
MPPRRPRQPRVATSTNADEGNEVRGLVDDIGNMLRDVMDRAPQSHTIKRREAYEAGAREFKGAKGPLDAYTWVDKMEKAFAITELPEERKVKMAVTFLDDSAHHWWSLASRNVEDALNMSWEQFKTLFLEQYFSPAHRSRIQSDFLNMKKRDDEGVIEFQKRFTSLSYHVSYLVPDERTRMEMFIGALGGVVGGGNDGPYTYGQNLTMPYSTYSMPYGVQSTESSDTSWSQSDVQSSNDYGYGQGQALPNPYNFQYGNSQSIPLDPYGWHGSFLGELGNYSASALDSRPSSLPVDSAELGSMESDTGPDCKQD